ncbi:MAG: hypothetical protein ACPGLV_01040 [Bacteroidia bacterium]
MLLNKLRLLGICFGVVSLVVFESCDAPKCEHNNPILEQAPMNSKPYNIEIARMINTADSNAVKYYFEDYRKIENNEYILVEVHTPSGCALARFTVLNQKGLETLIEKQGGGYHGAELLGFNFTIDGDQESMPLVCKGVDAIFD